MTDLPPDAVVEISKAVGERVSREEEQVPVGLPTNNGKLPMGFVRDCMYSKELGDGLLYATVNRNHFCWNAQAREWLKWTGHTWAVDILEEHLVAAEQVVHKLLEVTAALSDQIQWAVKSKDEARQKELGTFRDVIFAAIKRYRTSKGREAMVTWSRTCEDPLAIAGHQLDLDPWLLGCATGVIDLRTGECRPGRPEEYITKASPVEWTGLQAPAPEFEKWILETLSDDADLVSFVQRALGYAMTGLHHEHLLIVLHGGGRNGKGTLVELISHVLGPLASPIQSEMLLDQGRSRSSAGPSPDIMSLRGTRLAFASETDENRRFSTSRVKWLTGGDTLVGRHPHDKREVHFTPTHTLILLTNNKPSAPDTDFAFWERVRLIPFKLAFVARQPSAANERAAKKGLVDTLKQEASGILAWLVRGCLAYQKEGLVPPLTVNEATADWRKAENEILDFIEDYCMRDDMQTEHASRLYDNFNRWFIANKSRKGISQTMFGRIMGKRFDKKKVEGVVYYVGLKLTKEVPKPDEEGKDGSMF